jgi:purine-nucleoside phosphorylase
MYLGTGLGQLVDHLEVEVAINYTDIPNFPVSTVEFHSGKLLWNFRRQKSNCNAGRFHLYEGYRCRKSLFLYVY